MKHIPRLELYEDATKEDLSKSNKKHNEYIIFRYPTKHRKSENTKMETQKTRTRKPRQITRKTTKKTTRNPRKITRKTRNTKKSLFALF